MVGAHDRFPTGASAVSMHMLHNCTNRDTLLKLISLYFSGDKTS